MRWLSGIVPANPPSVSVDEPVTNRDPLPGMYSNHLIVGSNAFEFVLDFAQFREGCESLVSVAAIVTTPVFAKAFSRTLIDSIAGYEDRYGEIPDVER